jgi:hypothetical protein
LDNPEGECKTKAGEDFKTVAAFQPVKIKDLMNIITVK